MTASGGAAGDKNHQFCTRFVVGQPRRFRDDFTIQKALNVLPGPRALTTKVKRCGPGHTGFRRCGQGNILEGRLLSDVARDTRIAALALRVEKRGSRRAREYIKRPHLGFADFWRNSASLSDVGDFCSDPTFTRASPG